MKIEGKLAIEVVGITAIVISLLLVTYELRLSREVAFSESVASTNELSLSVRELIIANSSVWEKGCLGDSLTTEERLIFKNILVSVYARFFSSYLASTQGTSNAPIQGFIAGMALNRFRYPGFNQMYLENLAARANPFAESISPGWISLVEAYYQRLVQAGFDSDYDVTFCGSEPTIQGV